MEEAKILKFLEHFSLVTVGEIKVPNFVWKKTQSVKLTESQFLKQWRYKGGNFYKRDGKDIEQPATKNFGIVTGYEDLECVDVDLKVFGTTKEKVEWWAEFLQLLKDNIFDFDEKFVIYKTKSEGFHLLYKSKRLEGNLKLASLKGHKEAILETRGKGGYVFAYPEKRVSEKSYFDIQYISDEDREVLMHTCRMYNYQEPIKVEPKIERKKDIYSDEGISPWDDFNEKNRVIDMINDEFTIVSNLKNKYVIKRHGATSAHSGYIFKDDNLMFLHSTGTCYPHETQLSPYAVYTYKNHNGNFSESAKELYKNGFGSRVVKKEQTPEPREKVIIPKDKLIFPIEIFPEPIQHYISECNDTLDSSIDYLGCSLMWLISLSVGNCMKVEVKKGWKETGTLWMAVVGKAGIGKTPSISNIIFPLEKVNNREISRYIKEYEKYEEYEKLTKKEKKDVSEQIKPVKKQFIANDITLEALVDLHQESDNAVGVFKDELAGWFKDMNKYKQGSDLEFWLSTWSGKSVNLNRMTRAGSFVASPLIPVLGGIQPGIFNSFYTDENKDNGFMDRMLLSYPELEIEEYNEKEMSHESLQWYSDTIISFFDKIRNKYIQRDSEMNIDPYVLHFSEDAKKEWIRMFNKITNVQNSEDENEYMKSMYPKQKSYIPRFAMLLHVFECAINNSMEKVPLISKESILKAEKLSEYFVNMAKKVKIDAQEVSEIRTTSTDGKVLSAKDKFKSIYKKNPDVNVKQVAEILGVSSAAIYKYKKEIQNEK